MQCCITRGAWYGARSGEECVARRRYLPRTSPKVYASLGSLLWYREESRNDWILFSTDMVACRAAKYLTCFHSLISLAPWHANTAQRRVAHHAQQMRWGSMVKTQNGVLDEEFTDTPREHATCNAPRLTRWHTPQTQCRMEWVFLQWAVL